MIVKQGYCPACNSGWIRFGGRHWACRKCKHTFAKPLELHPRKYAGSGQIAGPCLYRQYKWKLSTRAKGAAE